MSSSDRRVHTALALCAALGCVALWTLASTAGAVSLPDGRVYEMVTPPLNHGADVFSPYNEEHEQSNPYTYRPMEAAADGERVVFVARPSVGGNERGGLGSGNNYLAIRRPAGGWSQEDLQPPGPWSIFHAFSPDLTIAVLDDHEALAPGVPGGKLGEFGYDDLYLTHPGEAPIYQPFFNATPPDRATERFRAAGVDGLGESEIAYAGASDDFHHLFFEANDALIPGAEGGAESAFEQENNLYESVGGQLRLVNVLSDGRSEAGATYGGPSGSEAPPDFSGAISADGSRVFWTDLHEGPNRERIFVREGGTSTVAVSAGAARYWAATPAGEYAFYSEAGGLYRFDVGAERREQLAGPEAEVQGVIGIDEAGDYAYVVADGVLPGSHGSNGQPTAGKPNLYLLHRDAGAWEAPVFIAALSPADDAITGYAFKGGGGGDWRPSLGHRTAEVSPNGLGIAFLSNVSQAGYATAGSEQVYLYDARSDRLFCASCASSEDAAGEGRIPISLSDTYQPRFISEDGSRVFFESWAALVPQDTNGKLDVYEWEEDGTGSCAQVEGCVYLLTGGTAPSESTLLDASATGSDVFVITRVQLLSQDEDENYDLYDARVDGVLAPTPPACSGTGCQGSPEPPPVFATPASVTFGGVGNFEAPAPPLVTIKHKRTAKQRSKLKRHRKTRTRHKSKTARRRSHAHGGGHGKAGR